MKYSWTKTTTGNSYSLKSVPRGATITHVDDKECFGICEACGEPILEGEEYATDLDGDTYVCFRCKEPMKEDSLWDGA